LGIEREQVQHVARLSRLALSEEELTLFKGQLARILDYIGMLEELDTSATPPLYHPNAEGLSFRQDIPRENGPAVDLKCLAPEFDEGHFLVPSILETNASEQERA
jgi:aspartyl-tRNA(Asn)/glutamyl-tRNA(Gln) amidotransferase subunit C